MILISRIRRWTRPCASNWRLPEKRWRARSNWGKKLDHSGKHEACRYGLFYFATLPVYDPVPVRLTFCGLPPPLSVMFSVPVRVPVAEGVNVTVMVQLAPPARLVPQVLVWE